MTEVGSVSGHWLGRGQYQVTGWGVVSIRSPAGAGSVSGRGSALSSGRGHLRLAGVGTEAGWQESAVCRADSCSCWRLGRSFCRERLTLERCRWARGRPCVGPQKPPECTARLCSLCRPDLACPGSYCNQYFDWVILPVECRCSCEVFCLCDLLSAGLPCRDSAETLLECLSVLECVWASVVHPRGQIKH